MADEKVEIIYDKINMEYGDKATLDKYSGKGGYQRARAAGMEKTYDLKIPGMKKDNAIFDKTICTINLAGHSMHGVRVVVRGFIQVNETDIGLLLGTAPGIKLFPEENLPEDTWYHCLLPKFNPSMLTKEKFFCEKTEEEKTKILAAREAYELEIGNRASRVTPDTN